MRRLTVLGATAAHPEPGEPCSGYLLEWDGTRLVIDLGYGTLAGLLDLAVPDPDAVVVTHEHPDHCADLHPLARRRWYAGAGPLPLYCPAGVLDRLAGLEPELDLTRVLDHHPLPGTARIGPLDLEGRALPHHVPTVGVRIEADGSVLAFATDTGPTPGLVELGRDADLLVLDATDRPGRTEADSRVLLTASEAGEWARRAGARRLLLTHLWPGTDPTSSAEAARRGFGGPVQVARRGLVIGLGG